MIYTRIAALLVAAPLLAATPQQARPDFAAFSSVHTGRTIPDVDNAHRLQLVGNIPGRVRNAEILGSVDAHLPMTRMILSLKMAPDAQYRLSQLHAAQQDPTSPYYHKWITAKEYGDLFGPSLEDVNAVASWLMSQGFTIDEVAPSRLSINFSGNAAQVQAAFRTSVQSLSLDGKTRYSNVTEPSIPMALSDVVAGVVSLNNIPRQAYHSGYHKLSAQEAAQVRRRVSSQNPDYTSGTTAYMAPNDFKTIYNVGPLYSAGVDGTGVTIGIVGRTDITLSDVTSFRSQMGLTANSPTIIHNGTDPGNLGGGEEQEADLDVEWSGAVARNATIKFVVSKSTTTDGVDLSAQYIVNNAASLGVSVMSTSFGSCESGMGSSENTFYNNLWSQAAAEGVTAFISAGDAGAAGCNGGGDTTGSGAAVNGLASTPYNICVGGTEFNEGSNFSTYWNATSGSDYSSAKSYIPEMAWNESGSNGGSNLWATGGGVSTLYSKPYWQVANGVPTDGKRDCPDVSLTAAGHDGYIFYNAGSLGSVGGTSASSPAFAGLMALIVQKTGSAQGNANVRFYKIGAGQFDPKNPGSGPKAFHDTPAGSNNSVPGVTGFNTGTGYDCATGLGSVDANALVTIWSDVTAPTAAPSVTGTSGTITLVSNPTDSGSGLSRVGFWVDNKSVTTVHSAPFQTTFDSTTLLDGQHTLKVNPVDNAGNYASYTVTFTTTNGIHDTTPPVATCSVVGTSGMITLKATATDNIGVNRVGFFIDGIGIKTWYSNPYQFTYDSTKLSNGTHTLRVNAVDTSGNVGSSTATFTVSN